MRLVGGLVVLWLSLLSISDVGYSQEEQIPLQAPYLGQVPPGLTPKAFAPGIVSTDYYEYSGTFSADMKEFYFIASGGAYEDQTFIAVQYKDNAWQKSVVSPRVGQPVISPDGQTMHLGRRYKQRTEVGWSEVRYLDVPFK